MQINPNCRPRLKFGCETSPTCKKCPIIEKMLVGANAHPDQAHTKVKNMTDPAYGLGDNHDEAAKVLLDGINGGHIKIESLVKDTNKNIDRNNWWQFNGCTKK